MTTIDLNHLLLFVRVVESGSFTAAARDLGLPKSSVSRSVAMLEKGLGVRLLQRTTRQLSLTEAGRGYFEAVSHGLANLGQATAEISHFQDEPAGKVRMTAPPDVGIWLLAPMAVQFSALYRDVHLDVALTQRVVDLVQEGFDLALRVGNLADTSLVAHQVGLLRSGLFASSDYLERCGRPRSVADLARHDCITFRSSTLSTVWELIGAAGKQRVEVVSVINADEFQFVREAALAGMGIALLPLFACSQQMTSAGLVRILPSYATTGVPLQIVYPNARFLPKRVMLLRDLLITGLRQRLADSSKS